MRNVALVGSLLISLLLLIIPLLFVFGPSGTPDENISHLPRTVAEAPVFFLIALVHLVAPVGIIAALFGWRFGSAWTIGFALLYGLEAGFLNWGYWHENRPHFYEIGWCMMAVVLWALYTIIVLVFASKGPNQSLQPTTGRPDI